VVAVCTALESAKNIAGKSTEIKSGVKVQKKACTD